MQFQNYNEIRWKMVKCPRCGSERGRKGRIRRYKHIEDGECFLCNGRGEITRERAIEEHSKHLRMIYLKGTQYDSYTYAQLVKAYNDKFKHEFFDFDN